MSEEAEAQNNQQLSQEEWALLKAVRKATKKKAEGAKPDKRNYVEESAEEFLKSHNAVYHPTFGQWYLYRHGFFEPVPEAVISSKLHELSGHQASAIHKNAVLRFLRDDVRVQCDPRAEFDESPLLNVSNGMLNPLTGELVPHNPLFRSTLRLPREYDAGATCPMWEEFIQQVLPDAPDDVLTLQEYFGYLLTPSAMKIRFRKSLMIVGTPEGRNGKSVMLHVLSHIFGGEPNVSYIPFSRMTEKFHSIGLRNSFVNISSETSRGQIDTELFKAICDGSSISDSWKGKDVVGFIPRAKPIFSMNTMPQLKGIDNAFVERLLLIEFRQYFPKPGDASLPERLFAEASGILNWMIIGLKRIMEQGRFTESENSQSMLLRYLHDTNHIRAWYEDCCQPGDADNHEAKTTIYKNYVEWTERNGMKYKHEKNSFFRKLYEAFPELRKHRDRYGEGQTVVGLRLVGPEELDYNPPENKSQNPT